MFGIALQAAIYSLAGYAAGLRLMQVAKAALPSGGASLLAIVAALFVAQWWLAILCHEVGHAAAAWGIGRRIHLFLVWPFAYLVRLKKLKVLRGDDLRFIGGLVLATPEIGNDWNRGKAFFFLGGIVGNVLVGGAAYRICASGLLANTPALLLESFAILSFAIAIATLLPVWGPGLRRSDGAQLVEWIRGRREPHLERLGWLAAAQADGVPPKEWDPALIAQVEADAEAGLLPAFGYTLLFARYTAMSDLPRCRIAIDALASRLKSVPPWVRIQQAFLMAYLDRDGPQAEKLLETVEPKFRKSYFWWRALAVTCLALDNGAGALIAVTRARTIAQTPKDLVMDEGEWALLAEIERNAQQQTNARAASDSAVAGETVRTS